MLSDDTIRRMKELKRMVKEFMDFYQVPEDKAWNMAAANGSYKAWELAQKINQRQEDLAEAEAQALSARANTYRTKKGSNKSQTDV